MAFTRKWARAGKPVRESEVRRRAAVCVGGGNSKPAKIPLAYGGFVADKKTCRPDA